MSRRMTRRGFGGLSVGVMASALAPSRLFAAPECVTPPREPYFPNILLVDCASRQNFKLFRRYSNYLGLAGVVSMTSVDGSQAVYGPGNLFLFPWVKPAGQLLRGAPFSASLPLGVRTSATVKPIPNAILPQDEYFCRFVLKAPWQSFIGFMVDTGPASHPMLRDWCTVIPKLSDGAGVEVDWTSANLNSGWFGGSHVIPSQATCNGSEWRTLITNALNLVATDTC